MVVRTRLALTSASAAAFFACSSSTSPSSPPRKPWATIPRLHPPRLAFEKLHLPVAPPSVRLGLEIAWKASLLLSWFGLFTRVSTLIAAALTLYMVGVPYNYGKVDP